MNERSNWPRSLWHMAATIEDESNGLNGLESVRTYFDLATGKLMFEFTLTKSLTEECQAAFKERP